jgi:hypothetical protein
MQENVIRFPNLAAKRESTFDGYYLVFILESSGEISSVFPEETAQCCNNLLYPIPAEQASCSSFGVSKHHTNFL